MEVRHSCHVTKTDSPLASGSRPLRLLSALVGLGLSLEALFLRECRRSPRLFWSLRACLGSGPAPGSHIKMAFWYLWGTE